MTALLKAPTVRKLQSKIGYTFKNPQYLWEAVQAPGSGIHPDEVLGAGTERHSVGFQKFPDGNKRLAMLGDTTLKLALIEDWYKGQESRCMAMRISNPERKLCLRIHREDFPRHRKRRRKPKSRHSRPLERPGRAHQQEPLR